MKEVLNPIGIVGAASYVGSAAAEILVANDKACIGFSRQARPTERHEWRTLTVPAGTERIERWIDVGPIWTFSERRDAIKAYGATKIVITSSTSRFTKQGSGSKKETETAERLRRGEEDFSKWCEDNGISWIILRPTLIYGLGRDKNVREIAAIIRKVGIFPIFGAGNGLRQPIHAEDLAMACVLALDARTKNSSYNVSGGQVLTYREMVHEVFRALGRRPLTPTVPLPLFRLACRALNLVPRFAHWTPQMAERMNADMAFDHSEATQDFGFKPRPFQLTPMDLA